MKRPVGVVPPIPTLRSLALPFSPAAVGVVTALLALLVSANVLANGLVWDDPIVLNRQLLAFRGLYDVIFIPRSIPQYSPDYYRPLLVLTYLLDRALGGGGPFMFHLSVLLYHVAVTYLVYRVGLLLFTGDVLAAGLGAALFAVHPIHSESVAWGAGRSDVVACCFSLAAVMAYWQEQWPPLRRSAVAAALLFLALLAKETAVALLLLVPASDAIILGPRSAISVETKSRSERRRNRDRTTVSRLLWLRYVPFAAAFIGYFVLRYAALGTVLGQRNPVDADAVAKTVAAVGVYLGKLLLPVRQSAYISDLPTGSVTLLAISGALVAAAAGTVVAWQRGARAVTFLVLWIALTLAPSLTIVTKLPSAPIAERYLYIPSVGFCLLVGLGGAKLLAAVRGRLSRALCSAAVLLVLATGAWATVQRNAVWRTNLRLWEDTAARNTTDGLPVRSLANAYLERGDAQRAGELFRQALQRRNDAGGQFNIHNNLGTLAMQQQRLDEAEQHYRTALGINPQAPDCLYNLALIALTRAVATEATHNAAWHHDQALQAQHLFEQAGRSSPLDPDIVVGLGQTLSALGDSSGARAQFEHALQMGLAPAIDASVRTLLAKLPRDAAP